MGTQFSTEVLALPTAKTSVENAVFDKWGSVLKANGIAVYLCLVRHANNDGTCYPSFNTIAKKCGVSRSTVVRTIDKLVELGLIKRERRNKYSSKEKTSNLYTIIDLSKVPEGEVVSERHHPSISETLPLVSERHHPSISEELEGNVVKETNFKETTTTTEPKNFSGTDEKNRSSSSDNCDVNGDSHQGERAQNENATNPPAAVGGSQVNSGEYELIFDFALKDCVPEQKRRILALLKDVPALDWQSILDELNSAISQSTVKSPSDYFSTLVKRYNTDEFTPTSDLATLRAKTITGVDDKDSCPYCKGSGQIIFMREDGTFTSQISCKHGQQARAYIQSVKRDYKFDFVDESKLPKNRLTAKDCSYCNERGMLDLRTRGNGKVNIRPCSHNPEKIKQLAREKDALIVSAKPGFEESPSINSKKRGGGLCKLGDVIGGLKADDDDVPF